MLWFKNKGDHDDVCISTRIRLARNEDKIPFAPLYTKEQAAQIASNVRLALEDKDFEFLNAFDKCEEIHLSLEKVTDFDVPGIQLIFASHKEALLRNKTFIVTGSINPTLERELRRHGLSVETFKTGIAFKNQIIKTSNYSDGDIQ